MFIRDLEGNEYPLQATTKIDEQLNGNQSLSLKILPTKVNTLFIGNVTEMWQVITDEITYKVVYAKRKGEGQLMSTDIKAVPLFFDDFDTQRVYERYDQHMTAQACFTLIFEGSGYNYVLVDSFDAIQWEGFGDGDTRLTLFKNALNRYGAEFEIVGNIVYLKKQVGRDASFMYRYRLNASNIVQEIDAGSFYTYAKGYGDYKEGEKQNAKLIKEYTSLIADIPGIGKRDAPPIENGNITKEETMNKQLKILVDESLKISVSANLHDLRKQGYKLAQPKLGDRVFLIDERIGLKEEVRVIDKSTTKDWKGNILDLSVTFGSEGLTKRHQANLNTSVKALNDLLEGRKKLPSSVFDDSMLNAVNAIKNAQTELQFPDKGGIWGIDPSNPNYVTGFTSHGFMVSIDGGNTAEAAITGEGVVAEKIIGQSIIGVNLSSVNEDGYFSVNGSDAEFFDVTNGRKVSISPNGIYSYNADNTERFRADGLLVTSAALGTSNSNVYLAPDSKNEVRVVDVKSIPSDGSADNYTYRPIRTMGVRFTPNGNGYLGTDGEIRVTSSGFQQEDGSYIYRPLRSSRLFSHGVIANATSLWMGTDSAMHVVNKGYANDGTGSPIYRDVFANQIWGGAFITRTENAYIGMDGVLKVVNKGLEETYRPVWAGSFENKSLRELKKDIEVFQDDVLGIIKSTNPHTYRMKTDSSTAKKQLGLMVDESPEIIKGSDGTTISQYPLTTYVWRGMQQIIDRLEQIEGDLYAS
ncbi:phage tail protein [Virgibacillus sp. AGTR]|uniref:phage tail protein n=1 Tax=Virgibacillus sp. AGTR TaxID=2812055 RepID=UPI001D15FA71|nr:phage tail protein [Virgibacillus sp. AGTR]MCC2248865.1 phage tail protein [Virgibacillus sp. AGTR]